PRRGSENSRTPGTSQLDWPGPGSPHRTSPSRPGRIRRRTDRQCAEQGGEVMRIQVTDVFLRDGLQDEPVIVSTDDKLKIAAAIRDAGINRLEVASFVNPSRVPQMGDAAQLIGALPATPGIQYTAL